MPRSSVPLLLALLLVLAGCSALPGNGTGASEAVTATDVPTATPAEPATATPTEADSPTPTATPEPTETRTSAEMDAGDGEKSAAVSEDPGIRPDDELAVNESVVRQRVESMIGGDTGDPHVRARASARSSDGAPGPRGNALLRTAGLVNQTASGTAIGWYHSDEIVIVTGVLDAGEQEQVLAHEYVHAVQATEGWLRPEWYTPGYNTALDESLTATALSEGSAEYADTLYVQRYMGEDPGLDARLRDGYLNGTAGQWLGIAPYYLGSRYAERNTESAADLPDLMEGSPRTTEQLLHDEGPTEEPPAGLELRTGELGSLAHTRQGELVTRLVLRTELNRSRAVAAAEGWGDDRLYRPDRATDDRFVWATRWDDPDEADEFEAAAGDWADARDGELDGRLRVERVAPETVAVVATADDPGDVTVEGSNETVTVDGLAG